MHSKEKKALIPFISFKAAARSDAFAKLTKPYPLVLPVHLSRIT